MTVKSKFCRRVSKEALSFVQEEERETRISCFMTAHSLCGTNGCPARVRSSCTPYGSMTRSKMMGAAWKFGEPAKLGSARSRITAVGGWPSVRNPSRRELENAKHSILDVWIRSPKCSEKEKKKKKKKRTWRGWLDNTPYSVILSQPDDQVLEKYINWAVIKP
ncbi:hypothetical protein D8B26_008160 [Coccidioides posadasii str. Silveira]|nr:hypothetical protein D8B26_008160 [Coccidioides posadasii str. Silveira]